MLSFIVHRPEPQKNLKTKKWNLCSISLGTLVGAPTIRDSLIRYFGLPAPHSGRAPGGGVGRR
jgi:hypothetical protein